MQRILAQGRNWVLTHIYIRENEPPERLPETGMDMPPNPTAIQPNQEPEPQGRSLSCNYTESKWEPSPQPDGIPVLKVL